MSFSIKCNNCHAELEADDSLIDHKLSCPSCEDIITIKKPTPEIRGTELKNKYPGSCIASGIIMLISSLLNFGLFLFLLQQNLKPDIVSHLISGVIFATSGILFIRKNKLGPLIAMILLGTSSIGLFFRITSDEFKIGNLHFALVVLDAVLLLVVALSIYAFHQWQKKGARNSSTLYDCPFCPTKLKIKTSVVSKKVTCMNCNEKLICLPN